MPSTLDQSIAAFCEAATQARTTPGGVIGYIRDAETRVLPFGRLRYDNDATPVTAQTVYDLASITKSIPTGSVILKLTEEGRLSLDDRVVDYLPELENKYREDIMVRHLLTFTVCFELGQPLSNIAKDNPAGVLEAIFKAPLMWAPGAQYKYTNAPSLLLGLIAERVSGRPLDEIAAKLLFEPLGMTRTTFHPERFAPDEVAPTEIDWRGEVQGVVHDPAAWALLTHGQTPGHAGLFSTAGDLLKFAQMLLDEGAYGSKRVLRPETVRSMYVDHLPHLETQAGLGWEIDREEAQGQNVSSKSFGKTGFTGTSIVVDPAKKAALVILCNRTYPHRGDKEAILQFWSGLSDLVFAD